MIINFNIEKLNQLLLDFYKITGLTISIWDSNLNQLCFQPKQMSQFCHLIKSCTEGKMRCFESDKEICSLSHKTNQPETHECHAGLMDTALPIKFKNIILGYIMFGQAKKETQGIELNKKLEKLSHELRIEKSQLLSAYNNLKIYNQDYLKAAGNILAMATQYIWLSDLIHIKSLGLATDVQEYIYQNITNKITISDICRKYSISKNKLYSIINEHFGMSVGALITDCKIKKAKHLLTTTSYTIEAVSDKCGFCEYNYFIKIFKQQTGYTPLKFRKLFPLDVCNQNKQ